MSIEGIVIEGVWPCWVVIDAISVKLAGVFVADVLFEIERAARPLNCTCSNDWCRSFLCGLGDFYFFPLGIVIMNGDGGLDSS